MKKLIVTGARGFLAARLVSYFTKKGAGNYEVIGITHQELDITDQAAVDVYLKKLQPDLVVHCAAISDIEMCRQQPERSWQINVDGTAAIARVCGELPAKLIFCSSDQVYTGSPVLEPHKETEIVHPPHLYGQQKLKAEQEVMAANAGNLCLRLSMMYAADYGGRAEHGNFLEHLLECVNNGTSPCYAATDYRDITDVWAVVTSMEKVFTLPGGIYNISSSNSLSTWESATAFLREIKSSIAVQRKEDIAALQPRNLRMDTSKLNQAGIQVPDTLTGLRHNARKLLAQGSFHSLDAML